MPLTISGRQQPLQHWIKKGSCSSLPTKARSWRYSVMVIAELKLCTLQRSYTYWGWWKTVYILFKEKWINVINNCTICFVMQKQIKDPKPKAVTPVKKCLKWFLCKGLQWRWDCWSTFQQVIIQARCLWGREKNLWDSFQSVNTHEVN